MKVIIIHEELRDEWRSALGIFIDGEAVFSVIDGEPEDNNLSRNFSDCYVIRGMMQAAYEAGKAGESFEIITENLKDGEEVESNE